MEFSMEFHGIPLNSMKLHGKFHGKFHEIPLNGIPSMDGN
jgi:hypothetical protein